MANIEQKTALVTILVMVGLAAAATLAVIYSGVINIAATQPHYALTKWLLETAMERSVERRARKIAVPEGSQPSRDTVRHYHEKCRLCHGAPGEAPSEIGEGMRPKPPELKKVADRMEAAEIFWVAKNGIRMTGMAAFGKTHRDEELWSMVSFVKSLPQMSPEKYRRLAAELRVNHPTP